MLPIIGRLIRPNEISHRRERNRNLLAHGGPFSKDNEKDSIAGFHQASASSTLGLKEDLQGNDPGDHLAPRLGI